MVSANNNGNDDPDSPRVRRLEEKLRRLELLQSSTRRDIQSVTQKVATINSTINVLQSASNNLPAAPSANFLWNGDVGHSVNSWHDTAYVTTDKSKELAWYFSHHKPFVPIPFTVITTNNELPLVAHGIETGTAVAEKTTGTLPTGSPAAGTTLFAYAASANVIKLATTQALALAGTPDVTFTAGTGSGTHGLEPVLIATDARTTPINQTMKRSTGTHSVFDRHYSLWNSERGIGNLNGTRTMDTPIPSNFLEPGQTARVGIRVARRSEYISIPDAALMYVGVVDNTAGQRDYLTGTTGFSATAEINGAATIERRYRMFVQTDRGYSILSPEVVVATAPDDGQYNSTNFVVLSWLQVAGYLNVQLWEFTPSTGVYRLLEESSSGTSNYIDNGSFLRTGVGYPTATATVRKCVFYTREGELRNLAIDPGVWDTVFFPAYVPDNYNKGLTTDRQWMRVGMTQACDLLISSGVTADGSTTLVFPASILNSAFYGTGGGSDYAGLTLEVLDLSSGATLYTRTVSSITSDTAVVVNSGVAAGSYGVRIVAGGFHPIYTEQIHMCFQQNVTFAPNPLDARVLQPVSAPSISTGGTGGGTGGGGVVCVPVDEPVELADGVDVTAGDLEYGNYVAGENMRPNMVEKADHYLGRVRLVKMKNGVEKNCTNSHRWRVSKFDEVGTPLDRLRVGDRVMTNLDGRDQLSPIVEIGPLFAFEVPVVNPKLQGGHWYRAGCWRPNRWWQKVLIRLGLMKMKKGTAYAHNQKPAPD